MDFQQYIDDYLRWLKSEITFGRVGDYYEVNVPFLDSANDYLQFYVKSSDGKVFFTDDGYTLNSLEASGLQLTKGRKTQLQTILEQYGVQLDGKDLTISGSEDEFPQKKHAFTQCLLHVSDLYMTSRVKSGTCFLDDIQNFFTQNDIFCVENVQFPGKSGFSHNYDFAIQRSKSKPERLCMAINSPNRAAMNNALFAWSDTRPSRRPDSRLIVLLNDSNPIGNGVENGFANYGVDTIRWSKRASKSSLNLLTA